MGYKEKTMAGTDILVDLSPPSNLSYFNEHYFCDYIETLALAANSDIVSVSDVIDRFVDCGEINTQGSNENNSNQDKWESRIEGWFSSLEVRKNEYTDFYPFEIDSNKILLKENLDNKHYFYLLLLLSSCLRNFNKSYQSLLTTDFELVSSEAFKRYLPHSAKIYKFGKSTDSNARYTGQIKDKINLFAEDLNLDICYKDYFFSSNDSGDYGLDVVAWIPFYPDKNMLYIQVFLAQCATGKDWLKKQDEPLKIQNSIIGLGNATNTLFIPYDARNTNRIYSEEAKIKTHLLFDRFRLICLLKDDLEFIDGLTSFNDVILKAVEFEEDIV